jgi:hypothetical protein
LARAAPSDRKALVGWAEAVHGQLWSMDGGGGRSPGINIICMRDGRILQCFYNKYAGIGVSNYGGWKHLLSQLNGFAYYKHVTILAKQIVRPYWPFFNLGSFFGIMPVSRTQFFEAAGIFIRTVSSSAA